MDALAAKTIAKQEATAKRQRVTETDVVPVALGTKTLRNRRVPTIDVPPPPPRIPRISEGHAARPSVGSGLQRSDSFVTQPVTAGVRGPGYGTKSKFYPH
jgi:hypothetical protein